MTPLRHARAMVHEVLCHVRAVSGHSSQYGILPGYQHRSKPGYFDDTAHKDEWQKEVYVFAAEVMRTEGLRTVYDVGCGSGFKLVKYLGEYETTGFDVPDTVSFLRESYPDRRWRSVPFGDRTVPPADLVVCSDVIEHVPDPDELIGFLEAVARRWIILSTPERTLMYPPGSRYHFGPPSNPTHLREWNIRELAEYVGRRFNILRHEITNHAQATQMIFCERRP